MRRVTPDRRPERSLVGSGDFHCGVALRQHPALIEHANAVGQMKHHAHRRVRSARWCSPVSLTVQPADQLRDLERFPDRPSPRLARQAATDAALRPACHRDLSAARWSPWAKFRRPTCRPCTFQRYTSLRILRRWRVKLQWLPERLIQGRKRYPPANFRRYADVFEHLVSSGKISVIWKVLAMPLRVTRSCVESRVMSRPSKTMLPEVGGKNPLIRLKKVVLPGAVRPDDRAHFTLRNVKRYVTHRQPDFAEPPVEVTIVDFENVHALLRCRKLAAVRAGRTTPQAQKADFYERHPVGR